MTRGGGLFTISLGHFSLANETRTKQGTRATQFLAYARQDSPRVAATILPSATGTLTRPSFPVYGKPGDMRARLARPKTISYCLESA